MMREIYIDGSFAIAISLERNIIQLYQYRRQLFLIASLNHFQAHETSPAMVISYTAPPKYCDRIRHGTSW